MQTETRKGKLHLPQGARFVLVGVLVTAIDVGVTWALWTLFASRTLAVTGGMGAGLLASYLLHALVSFESAVRPFAQVPRFLTLVALNYLETLLVVFLATEKLGMTTLGGKLLSLPLVAVTSYVAMKTWVYAPRPNQSGGQDMKHMGH